VAFKPFTVAIIRSLFAAESYAPAVAPVPPAGALGVKESVGADAVAPATFPNLVFKPIDPLRVVLGGSHRRNVGHQCSNHRVNILDGLA
jgi:hypothetical protein